MVLDTERNYISDWTISSSYFEGLRVKTFEIATLGFVSGEVSTYNKKQIGIQIFLMR